MGQPFVDISWRIHCHHFKIDFLFPPVPLLSTSSLLSCFFVPFSVSRRVLALCCWTLCAANILVFVFGIFQVLSTSLFPVGLCWNFENRFCSWTPRGVGVISGPWYCQVLRDDISGRLTPASSSCNLSLVQSFSTCLLPGQLSLPVGFKFLFW